MAFNTKELEIIKYGVRNGKSRAEVEDALTRLRTGQGAKKAPEPVAPTYGEQVAESAKAGVAKIGEGIAPSETQPSLVESAERGLKVGAGAIETALSPLAPLFSPIGKLIGYVTDKISDIKGVQEFATSPAGETTARIAEDVANASTIAGTVAGGLATPKVAGAVRTGTQAGITATKEAVAPAIETVAALPSKAKSWVQTPLKANVQTVLKETPVQKFDQYVNIARNAAVNNKNQTPLEFAGTQAQSALDQINRKLATIGANKSAVIQGTAGRTPTGNIVVKFRQGLQNALKNKTSVEGDAKIYRDILTEAEKLGNNPSAAQVDSFIDFVQDRIYTGGRDLTVPVTDAPQQILRPLTGQLNNSLKSLLPESYRTLNQQFADMVGMRNELNLKLGAGGEKGGALMKRVFSPSDANTKQLFANVLDETGIDLVNEATLARYMMDVLGDARQKSMLEQLNLSATKPTAGSLTTRFLDYLIEKANTPDEIIQRARSQTLGGGSSK